MSGCEVRLEGVRRLFSDEAAVDDVTLTAPAGAVTALLGASGSGKSTLLRMIAGLEPVDGGRVVLGGAVVSAPGVTVAAEHRRVGLVFQDYALFPHLTAGANVAFGLSGADKAARRAEAGAWLDRVGLAHRADAFPHELSGGEQQRVALARALAPRPRAILLDEPVSGLDPGLRADLRDRTRAAIAELGATAVFVTHDADEALYIADQIAILRAGRLVQAGPPRAVYDHPASPEAAAALGPVNRFDGVAIGGVLSTPFGPLRAERPDGPATAIVRAEAVTLHAGDGARVLDRRPQGAFDVARIAAGNVEWRALIAARAGPQAGEACAVKLTAEGAFVFDRTRAPAR
ncbi:MAG: ABC transporter ATP-binding protein [Hyphomonadaceae bacterium]|nr:ABC transporter ATP-binding protein [Hyphomonadaceae bacterium]